VKGGMETEGREMKKGIKTGREMTV